MKRTKENRKGLRMKETRERLSGWGEEKEGEEDVLSAGDTGDEGGEAMSWEVQM